MKIGQTTFVHFGSKVLASILGFVATVVFARILGAGPLGTYFLALAVVSWLSMANNLGIGSALNKRVSEGTEQDRYVVAGLLLGGGIFVVLAGAVLALAGPVNSYLGTEAAAVVVGLLFATVCASYGFSILNGLRLVHVSGIFTPVKTFLRATTQIALVLAGFGLVGLFAGYAVAYVGVALLSATVAYRHLGSLALPRRRHFESLLAYARFSWMSRLDRQSFASMDVVVLGYFVSSSLVGIYSTAWSVAQFLGIFNSSVTSTLFPELSNLSENEGPAAVAELFEDGLAYVGLFLIPGLVGGALLGERILRIYGEEFTAGAVVFVVLIAATLLDGYRKLFVTALNAVDRPDLSFRINLLFMTSNLVSNVVLVWQFGWIGAAVATAGAVAISLGYSYVLASSRLSFSVPVGEIGCQTLAAAVMGGVVLGGQRLEATYSVVGHNFALVLILVALGAGTYFLVLFGVSARFRTTVRDNVPLRVG